jgi:hypothetical protein
MFNGLGWYGNYVGSYRPSGGRIGWEL